MCTVPPWPCTTVTRVLARSQTRHRRCHFLSCCHGPGRPARTAPHRHYTTRPRWSSLRGHRIGHRGTGPADEIDVKDLRYDGNLSRRRLPFHGENTTKGRCHEPDSYQAGRRGPPAPPMPEVAGVSHRFIQTSRLRVHVAEAGAGRPVVLLHGPFQHWYAWREVIPALAASYRVICPDLRGHGWTETPPSGY